MDEEEDVMDEVQSDKSGESEESVRGPDLMMDQGHDWCYYCKNNNAFRKD